jgi:hypothetical protein
MRVGWPCAPRAAAQAKAIELVCRCDEIPDERVELAILKALLTSTTSTTLTVHGQASRDRGAQVSWKGLARVEVRRACRQSGRGVADPLGWMRAPAGAAAGGAHVLQHLPHEPLGHQPADRQGHPHAGDS